MSASLIKDLRKMTGAGILDCKKALDASEGDLDAAVDWLRAKGISKAAKKASRIAAEGLVVSYIHGGGNIGVLVEVNSETDFVARNESFQDLCRDIAMHIAAAAPIYVSRDDIPEADIEAERKIQIARAVEEGKPANIAEKMVEGRLKKWFTEVCLLDQPFIKDDEKTVGDVLTSEIARIGENLKVRRFVRYVVGEGLEKRSDDFAGEVAAAVAGG